MTSHRILTPDEVLPANADLPPTRGRRRRSSKRRRHRRRLLLALVAFVGVLAAVATFWNQDTPVRRFAKELTDIELALPPVASIPARRARTMYRYSVVPGGVYSRSELQVAVATDPVVAAHYQGFDVSRARLTRVDKPRAVHVSYRLGDKVYWTRDKIWLRAGEALLTDGEHQIRGRCGNRVSELIEGPPAMEEIPLEAFDAPIAEPPPGIAPLRGFDLMFVAVPEVQPTPMPFSEAPLPSTSISILPTPPPLVVETVTPDPPEIIGPVPEPGTLALLGSGAALLLARRLKRRV
jgi:hypothetical protein